VVQRVGDDEAEHGVAEELQSLVRREPAVLVGVRAVGQGALEQSGVDTRAERRLEERVLRQARVRP
jgi:DNA transposition AAA+ family ATPase